jgi:O-antigen/teichoic acid export membrane protein
MRDERVHHGHTVLVTGYADSEEARLLNSGERREAQTERVRDRKPYLAALLQKPTAASPLARWRRTLANPSLRGASATFLFLGAGSAVTFLFHLMLVRLIGDAGFGIFFLSATIINIGVTISRLGFEHSIVRFAAVAHENNDSGALASLYRQSMGLSLVAGLFVAVPLWYVLARFPLAGRPPNTMTALYPMIALSIPPMALITIYAGFLKSIRKPGISSLVQFLVMPSLLLVSACILWFCPFATVRGVMLAYCLSAVVSMLAVAAIWHRFYPGLWKRPGNSDMRLLIKTSLPLLAVTCLSLTMDWTDILILGAYVPSAEVGIYGVSSRIALLISFVLIAANSILAPRFAQLHSSGKRRSLERLAQQGNMYATLVVVLPTLLIICFAGDLLALFGESFRHGRWILTVLMLGQFVNVGTGSVGYLLMMTGHEITMRNIILLTAVFNVLGQLLVIPTFGAMGAAIVTATSVALLNILSLLAARRTLGINTLGYLAARA